MQTALEDRIGEALRGTPLQIGYKRKTCRLCESLNVELICEFPQVALAEKYFDKPTKVPTYPVDLYWCNDCHHVQQLDVVHPWILWDDYIFNPMKKMRDHFDEFSGTFENAPAFVIDIGSNDGSLLESFRRRGSRVLGVDAARDIAREATRNGIPTVGEMLNCRVAEKIVSEHGKAELVTAFNVFAHNDDLSGMLDAIKILMKPEGRFCFEAQYLGDILDKALFATLFHEHLSHHSVGSLFKFFKKHGMTLVDVKRNDIQHGSIIGTAVLGKGEISENVTDLIWEEGWINKETVWRFGRKVSDIRNRITYKGWGYGAAHSGPTLIDLLNLKIDKIVDDHPQKVGKWAGEIEVLPTKELLRGMPEYCFILAWVHNDRIIENAREYMKRGGKMVVLCPDFRVINHG